MSDIKQKLRNYLESGDFSAINDFLIDLSSSVDEKSLKYVDFLLNVQDEEIRKNYILNLIFYLGEFGKKYLLDEKYIIFMKILYFQSDRWVRNEIITSIWKVIKTIDLNENLLIIAKNALTDEYLPIKLSALKIINQLDKIPQEILLKVVLNLKSKNSEIIELSSQVIKNHIKSNKILIKYLYELNIISPKIDLLILRNLLVNLFESVMKLEKFREDLIDSKLSKDLKERLLRELEIMQKILLKSSNY